VSNLFFLFSSAFNLLIESKEDLRNAREKYTAEMVRNNAAKAGKAFLEQQKRLAYDLVFGPPKEGENACAQLCPLVLN
jgi:hypothetical protein